MKKILIILNILLGSAVLFGGLHLFHNTTGSKKAGFSVKKKKTSSAAIKTVKKKNEAALAETKPASLDELSKEINENNIFNQERCPNIGFNTNARVDLTLVGTFKTGKVSGAIILQKTQSRNMMPFMPPGAMGGMNNNGMMGGGGRQMGIGRGGMGGMGGFNSQEQGGFMNRGIQQRSSEGYSRRQIGGARNVRSIRNANGLVIPGTTNSTLSTKQAAYKQYVRLGETLSNGYKLVEVERTRVTLQRGTDRIELELADASQNAPKKAAAPARTNFGQLMQQMVNTMQGLQRAQGFQNFQMMRAMQNMNNTQGGGGGMGGGGMGGPRRR